MDCSKISAKYRNYTIKKESKIEEYASQLAGKLTFAVYRQMLLGTNFL